MHYIQIITVPSVLSLEANFSFCMFDTHTYARKGKYQYSATLCAMGFITACYKKNAKYEFSFSSFLFFLLFFFLFMITVGDPEWAR